MSENVDEAWSRIDWADLTPRLLLFTAARVRLTSLDSEGLSAEDLVQQAIQKTLAGKRRWNPERCDLFTFLAGVVQSDVSTACSKRNRKFDKLGPQVELDEEISISIDGESVKSPEDYFFFSKQREELLIYLKNQENFLANITEIILDKGVVHSKDLAEIFEMTEQEINNAKKRLRRAILAFAASSESPEQQAKMAGKA